MNTNAQGWADIAGTDKAHQFIASDWYQSESYFKMSGIMSAGDLLYAIAGVPGLINAEIVNNIFLEIGCGTGRSTEFFAKVFKKVTAVDCGEQMIAKGKIRVPDKNIEWIVNDGETLKEISDGSVDIAYSFIVFQHMQQPTVEGYMKEVYRVLKPGGYFFFQLGCYDEHKEPVNYTDYACWTEAELRNGCAKFQEIKITKQHFGLHIFKKI